jgi:hypothetical protein
LLFVKAPFVITRNATVDRSTSAEKSSDPQIYGHSRIPVMSDHFSNDYTFPLCQTKMILGDVGELTFHVSPSGCNHLESCEMLVDAALKITAPRYPVSDVMRNPACMRY